MAASATPSHPLSLRMLAFSKRFIRWLTRPQVTLSLVMLVVMFYMIVIPLYGNATSTIARKWKEQVWCAF